MVRILANGDIVQDDDPRVQKPAANQGAHHRREASSSQFSQQEEQRMHQGEDQNGPTIFDTWNQKLIELGIPRWNIGTHVVEPIMTVMVVLVLLFFGVPGVIFLGLLYFVVKISQGNPQQGQSDSFRLPRTRGGFGEGRRLGR